MSETTEPLVPLLDPARELMAAAQALRQAAIDVPKDLPPGLRFSYTKAQGEAGELLVIVKAEDAFGAVHWRQPYNGRGHRVTVIGGIDF